MLEEAVRKFGWQKLDRELQCGAVTCSGLEWAAWLDN